MTAGVIVSGSGRVACLVGPLPERCERRADALRSYAERYGIRCNPVTLPETVARRLVWDAPAAAEYPRPIMADAVDVCELRPDLSLAVWHAAAGAIITAPGCDCDTPAGHRDTLAAIAHTLTEGNAR